MDKRQKRINFIISFGYYAIIILIVFFGIKYLLGPLLPFITAFLIVSMSGKIFSAIDGRVHSKKCTAIIFTVSFIFVVSLIIFLVFYGIFNELSRLISVLSPEKVQKLYDGISGFFTSSLSRLSSGKLFSGISLLLSKVFENSKDSFSSVVSEFLPKLLSLVMKFLSFFPGAVIFTGIVFISMFYIGCDYDRISNFLIMQLPDSFKDTFDEAKSVFTQTAKELFKSYFLLTIITFFQLFIGFAIIGIDYALLLAGIICIVDLLPILGTGTVLIPWSAICFMLKNYRFAIGLIILYAVITLFRQIAEPRIVGANIGLSPLLSLISIFVGLKTMGFAGIIVFPIITMTIIRLNEKGFIRLYKNFPKKQCDDIRKTKLKFLNFKRHDKK